MDFDLSGQVAGVLIPSPFTLNSATDSTVVQVSLADPLFSQPSGSAKLPFTATFDPNDSSVCLAATFNPPEPFCGGNLVLNALSLVIQTRANGGGKLGVDTTAAQPVTATGQAAWVGKGPELLQAPGGQIPFAVSYAVDAATGHNGFALALSQKPLNLSRLSVTVQEGSMRIDVLPDEAAVVLAVEGQAALGAAGSAAFDKIRAVLDKLFGAGKVNVSNTPAFRFQHKYQLRGDGTVGAPLSLPTFSLLPDWSSLVKAADLVNAPNGIDLVLGAPRFRFSLPENLGALPDFDLHLLNSTLRFPDLGALKNFAIAGNLHFVEGNGTWSLAFLPSIPGGVTLPEILQFFLAQFNWGAQRLEDLFGLGSLTQVDLDWYRLFQGLLPGTGAFDPAVFKTAFQAILDAALKLPNAPSLDHLFDLAFRALQSGSTALFTAVWDIWLSIAGSAARLPDLLANLSLNLPQAIFYDVLGALLDHAGLDLDALLSGLLSFGRRQFDADIEGFLKFWVPFLSLGIAHLDPDKLGQALLKLLKNLPVELSDFRLLSDFSFLQGVFSMDLPAFQLPTGLGLAGAGLTALTLLSGLPLNLPSLPTPGTFFLNLFDGLVQKMKSLFAGFSLPSIDAGRFFRLMHALFTNAQGDPEAEWALLALGRFVPLGILFALIGAVKNLFVSPVPWWRLLFHSIEEDSKLKVKRFAAPAPAQGGQPARKYLVISDMHRDAASDRRPPFDTGSIFHFLSNQALYMEILDYALQNGYTLLEGGDCEELWFVRDFASYPMQGARPDYAAKVREIMTTHPGVYDLLYKLHVQGRYFRIYGNHDSQLRDPAVAKPLTDFFERPDPNSGSVVPFIIYDYFIIDGVKTMSDFGALELAGDVWSTLTGPQRTDEFLKKAAVGRIGFDSTPYTDKKPLIVTHGHQFDFWNCDENNLVGKLFANSVGVPADSINDPFTNMGGIALAGSPLIDFEDGIANLPVFSNFPSYEPAAVFAHRIQHQDDKDRLLINDLFYIESIPALVGSLAMPLTVTDSGATYKWSELTTNSDHLKHFFDHLGNMICVGHTHYPQSQPYYDTASILLSPPLKALADGLREAVAKVAFGFKPPLNFLKSRYFNSGTAGWMEGIIWAMNVDDSGQARLMYWTRDTRIEQPQYMDWELPQMDAATRAALQAKVAVIANDVQQFIDKIRAGLTVSGMALSFETLLAFADVLAKDTSPIQLSEVDLGATGLAAGALQVRSQVQQLADVVVKMVLAVLVKNHPTAGLAAGQQTFSISLPLPGEVDSHLGEIQSWLGHLPGVPAGALAHLSCVWLAASQGLPFVNGSGFRGELPLKYPVLFSLLSLLPLLPTSGAAGMPVTAAVSTGGGKLSLQITVA